MPRADRGTVVARSSRSGSRTSEALKRIGYLAKQFIEEAIGKHQVPAGQLTIHAHRGRVMKSKPVAFLMADLGVTKSHSRPYVSDDNPYSESQFRTMKYRPEFPDRFGCIQDSRAFCQQFFQWYNEEHRHSGIALLTPAVVHFGETQAVLANRQVVLDAAYQAHPDRFVRRRQNRCPCPRRFGSTSPSRRANRQPKVVSKLPCWVSQSA
jgi:putative transposase